MANCKNCCSTEEPQNHSHDGHSHDDHSHNNSKILLGASLVIFFAGIIVQYVLKLNWFVDNQTIRLVCYFLYSSWVSCLG